MKEYIEKLKTFGYSTAEAARIYQFFILYFNKDLLDYFISRLERDAYVAEIQS